MPLLGPLVCHLRCPDGQACPVGRLASTLCSRWYSMVIVDMSRFVTMLLANLVRSGKCMLPLGLHSPRGPDCASCAHSVASWFARMGPVLEPCFQLSLSDRCVRCSLHFWLDAHALPIEMGRRPPTPGLCMAQVARICPVCPGMHAGDERHYLLESPAFDDIRRGFQHLFDDSHGAKRLFYLFMWHTCQKDVALYLSQLLDRIAEALT